MTRVSLGAGTYPDVLYHGGWGYLTVRQKVPTVDAINVYRWPIGQLNAIERWKTTPQTGGHSFPKLGACDDDVWLAWRTGPTATGFVMNLTANAAPVVLGPTTSNYPFGFGPDGMLGWRKAGTRYTQLYNLRTGARTQWPTPRGTSWGLAELLTDNTPIYMDDLFHAVSWGTRVDRAGELAVVEGPQLGVLARFDTLPNKQVHLWPGTITEQPQCAAADDGTHYAAVTGGPVRVAEFTQADAGPIQTTIPTIGRPCWLAFFKEEANLSFDPGGDYPTYGSLPGNLGLIETVHGLTEFGTTRPMLVSSALLQQARPFKSRILGWFCHGSTDAQLSAQGALCKAAYPAMHTYGCVDRRVSGPQSFIAKIDVPLYELYPDAGESVAQMEQRLDRVVASSPYSRVGLVVCCYRRGGMNLPASKLLACVESAARLARRHGKIQLLLPFAANRLDGLRDPELKTVLLPALKQLRAGIPATPPFPPAP